MNSVRIFVFLCCIAAIIPFRPAPALPAPDQNDGFPGWLPLAEWVARPPGQSLQPWVSQLPQQIWVSQLSQQLWVSQLDLSSKEQKFYANFPGRVACFRIADQRLILRWVKKPTRMLHPAAHCFRASGFAVTPLPLHLDDRGRRWSRFRADTASESLIVREHILDSAGRQWADVSAWYWAALLGYSQGPWWVVTHIETAPVPPGRTQL